MSRYTSTADVPSRIELDSLSATITSEYEQAQATIARLEQQEVDERARAQEKRDELDRIAQLKNIEDAKEKLRGATARIQELEESRMAVESERLNATRDIDTMRSGLYELPMPVHPTHTRGDGNPKLNKLQAEAYIERHDLDNLMEDMLAVMIEYMPTYPHPFLIKFLKQRAGLPDNELQEALSKNADLGRQLSEAEAAQADECAQHDGTKQQLDQAHTEYEQVQTQLQKMADEARDVHSHEQATKQQADAEKKAVETELQREKDQVDSLHSQLEKTKTSLQQFKDALAESQSLVGQLKPSAASAGSAQKQLEKAQTQLAALKEEREAMRRELEGVKSSSAAEQRKAVEAAVAEKKALQKALQQQKATSAAALAETKQAAVDEIQAAEHQRADERKAAEHERATAAKAALVEQKRKAFVAAPEAESLATAEYTEEAGVTDGYHDETIDFKIFVKTGDVKHAGTDAHVHMQMFGDKGESDRFMLAKSIGHKDKFERSRTDIFEAKATDIGKLSKILIGHDGAGLGAGWYLESVRIEIPALGKCYKFDAERWLEDGKNDHKLEIEVTALEATLQQVAPQADYAITVHTAAEKDASLDHAQVYIVVYGDEGKTEEQKLARSKASFKKGGTDTFVLTFDEIKVINKIRVRHGNEGTFGATWKIDSVEMHDRKHDVTYKCDADRWLRKKEGIEAEFPVTSKVVDGVEETVDHADLVPYQLAVVTGKTRGSGTDATVHITINGDEGDTGDRQLRKSSTHFNKFENGNTDQFIIEAVNLGSLKTLKVWHENNALAGSDWELDHVVVTDPRDGTETLFNCHSWLSKSKGLSKILQPDAGGPEELRVQKAVGLEYAIEVYTSNIKDAGTDAKVFLCLYGEHGDTGEQRLTKSSTHSDPFQRKQRDVFSFNAPDIGALTKLKVWHNNGRSVGGMFKSTDPSWHLQEVHVGMAQKGQNVIFEANRWLAKGKDDGLLEAYLTPSGSKEMEVKHPWEVEVSTSTKRGAGTDANIRMTVYGKNAAGENTEAVCDFKSQATDDMFERGDIDPFAFELGDIGEPVKIRLEQDGNGLGDDWLPEKVAMKNPTTHQRFDFDCDQWVYKNKPVELYASRKMSADGSDVKVEEKEEVQQCDYTLAVVTSGVKNAGTDSNIKVTFHGDTTSGPHRLKKSKTNINKFEKGKTDMFDIKKLGYLGDVFKITVESDGDKGVKFSHPEWKPERFVLEDDQSGVFTFQCDKWFSKKKEGLVHEFTRDGYTPPSTTSAAAPAPRKLSTPPPPPHDELDAASGGGAAATSTPTPTTRRASAAKAAATSKPKPKPKTGGKQKYEVKVLTAKNKKSGTDAKVTLSIDGTLSAAKKLVLKKSEHKDKFEKGQTDTFTFDLEDVGEIKSIELESDGGRGMSHKFDTQWELATVNIAVAGNEAGPWAFDCNQWFNKKEGKKHSFEPDDDVRA